MKLIINLLFYTIIFVFSNSIIANTIEYVDVRAKGSGSTYSEALNNALSNAIAKVNGRSIDTQSSLEKISKVINSNNDNIYFSSKKFEKKISDETKGYVSNFKIVSETKSDNNIINIQVSAKIGKFKLKNSAKRKRIAVFPLYFTQENFKLFDKNVSAQKIDRLLTQSLVSYLVQTRKFTVLDREYFYDIESELSLIRNNVTPIEESVKLGQKLFSDYILVGTLEKLFLEEKDIKIKNSNTVVKTNNVLVEFNYRIIDVPTSQIMFSDDYRGVFTLDNLQLSSPESEIIQLASLEIGSKILNAIYPLRIEKINDNIVYIGQGGLELNIGEIYNIVELGERIKDSYTNEYIGREQKEVGKLKIIDVGSKLSTGEIVSETYRLADEFELKKYIIKKIYDKKSKLEIAKEKINNKEGVSTDDDW